MSTIFSSKTADKIPPKEFRISLLKEKAIIKINIQIIMDISLFPKILVKVSIVKV